MRLHGGLAELTAESGLAQTVFSSEELQSLTATWLSEQAAKTLADRGSVDGAMMFQDRARLRFNVFRSGGQISVAIRKLEDHFRPLAELGLPDDLYRICELRYGLVLVAGPTGSGKSTTLATLLNRINETRAAHVITIEDPVEYVHRSQRSLVNQRQIGLDSPRFNQALVDALRQDPDVILIGEIRDLETIRTAITAAETGHLVFASVHAGDCVGAVERLISVFPADEQAMVQRLLGMALRCVITQHLIVAEPPSERNRVANSTGQSAPVSNERVLAAEIMWGTPAVANLIASGQTRQIGSMIESGGADGMLTLDASLAALLRQRKISETTARTLARNPRLMVERARMR